MLARPAAFCFIRNADVETLKELPSMNEAAAESVYNFFHPKV